MAMQNQMGDIYLIEGFSKVSWLDSDPDCIFPEAVYPEHSAHEINPSLTHHCQ